MLVLGLETMEDGGKAGVIEARALIGGTTTTVVIMVAGEVEVQIEVETATESGSGTGTYIGANSYHLVHVQG